MIAEIRRAEAVRLVEAGEPVKYLHALGGIDGVTVLAVAAANGPGVGRIEVQADGNALRYRAPLSTEYGEWVDCTEDGELRLEDGEDAAKWVRISVSVSYLVPNTVGSLWLADRYNNQIGHDDVSAAEAAAGLIESWTVGVRNDGLVDALNVKVWLEADVGLWTSSTGIFYYKRYSEATAITGWTRIAPGETKTLYLRRTITAGAQADPRVLNWLHLGWDGY
jgi:hypothetical protein